LGLECVALFSFLGAGMRKQYVEFANFICRFGEKAVLLDRRDIVQSAILGSSNRYFRKYGDAKYFLHRATFIELDDPELGKVPALAGRIVKDTILRAEQLYSQGRLTQASTAMPSAPSSFFVLILHNHRLLYVREMAGSPTLEQFGLTVQTMLRSRWKEFVRDDSEWLSSDATTIKARESLLPRPTVTVVPFASSSDIVEQVGRFDVLSEVSITFNGTNHEIDNDDFFRKWQDLAGGLGSDKSRMRFSSADGLNQEAAKSDVTDAKASGNQRVALKGKDALGNKLVVTDEDFQLRSALPAKIKKQVPSVARKLYDTFLEIIGLKLVPVPPDEPLLLKRARQSNHE